MNNYIITDIAGVANLELAGLVTQKSSDIMTGNVKRTAGNSGRKDVTSGSKQKWEIRTQATIESFELYKKMYAYLKAKMWQKETIFLSILNGSISGYITMDSEADFRGKVKNRQYVSITIEEA